MSELEDRQDAAPAIETPAPAPLTPAPTTAYSSADDHQALAAVEGAVAFGDEAEVAPSEVELEAEAEATAADEVQASDAAPAIEPDEVEATAVLVLEDEPVALAEPGAQPEPHAPVIEWVASVTEVEPDDAPAAAPTPDWAAHVPETELSAPPSSENDEPPLLDDELEHGIASIFAALHSATQAQEAEPDDAAAPLSEADAAEGITYRLLGELDRLWHRAA